MIHRNFPESTAKVKFNEKKLEKNAIYYIGTLNDKDKKLNSFTDSLKKKKAKLRSGCYFSPLAATHFLVN